MSAISDFYRVRAEAAHKDAAAATLDNVRQRHLTAAAAWEVMAARGERTERARHEVEARKAAIAQDEAEAAEREPAELPATGGDAL
ncbi:MAG: hypothetical protein ACXWUX_03955 [Allosphingosinicella sp.]